MSPQTSAEDRVWAAYDQLLNHGAGCPNCSRNPNGPSLCAEGKRLAEAHRAAKRAGREEEK